MAFVCRAHNIVIDLLSFPPLPAVYKVLFSLGCS